MRNGSLVDVVVVGSGPAGVAFAEQLCRYGTGKSVLLLGDEPSRLYDRVRLLSRLARQSRTPVASSSVTVGPDAG